MTVASTSTELDVQLGQLVTIAGDLHDLLAAGDWEAALVQQIEYDEHFARFIFLADRGAQISPELVPLLTSLQAVHDENLRLASELQAEARGYVSSVSTTRKVNEAYSPLGANHQPAPRYIDGAA